MNHKYIIELANGMPYTSTHKSGESEAQANLSYELVIEEVLPKVTPTDNYFKASQHPMFFEP